MWLYRSTIYTPLQFTCLPYSCLMIGCFLFLAFVIFSRLKAILIQSWKKKWNSIYEYFKGSATMYRNWSYFEFFPNNSPVIFQTNNKRANLTGISIFSPFGTKNRLKVKHYIEYIFTIIIIKISKSKSSRRKLGISWKDDTFPSKYSLFPNRIFLEISPTTTRFRARNYTRACTWTSIRFVTIDRENRFTFYLFFSFFCENACVAYVGRSKWKASQRGPMGRYRYYPPARSYEPFIGW